MAGDAVAAGARARARAFLFFARPMPRLNDNDDNNNNNDNNDNNSQHIMSFLWENRYIGYHSGLVSRIGHLSCVRRILCDPWAETLRTLVQSGPRTTCFFLIIYIKYIIYYIPTNMHFCDVMLFSTN